MRAGVLFSLDSPLARALYVDAQSHCLSPRVLENYGVYRQRPPRPHRAVALIDNRRCDSDWPAMLI